MKFIFRLLVISVVFCQVVVAEVKNEGEMIFDQIYKYGLWGRNKEGEGFSGEGSTPENTILYKKFLEDFIQYNEIQTVLDVGCGDWTFSQHVQWGKTQYTGIDVVKSVIEKNKMKFSSPNMTFLHCDPNFTDLPSADLLICKDVLQHLSNETITLLLNQLSKYKYCLITNDNCEWNLNKQIQTGDHRGLDLQKPPFNVKGVKILTFPSGFVTKHVFYIQDAAKKYSESCCLKRD
jgi:SAM-dependent methyltransferase